MKYKTTRKAITQGASANTIICAGYCSMAHLLHDHEPIAYTAGVYGWNFDVYSVNGLTICTGYHGMPGRRANNTRIFEEKARAIWSDYNISRNERAAAVKNLLAEFCRQA